MAKRTGFTLVELLITLMIGGVIMAIAAQAITSHIRTTSRQEVLQRLRDHWGRINHLINTEALEGASLETDQNIPNCANGTASDLTIRLPNRSTAIHYYNDANNSLWRCGPDIGENGRLANDADAPVTSLVAKNAALVATPDSNDDAVAHEMTYSLTLTARSNGQDIPYTASSRAQTTSRTY